MYILVQNDSGPPCSIFQGDHKAVEIIVPRDHDRKLQALQGKIVGRLG
jgi:hypothetical protein